MYSTKILLQLDITIKFGLLPTCDEVVDLRDFDQAGDDINYRIIYIRTKLIAA